MRLKNKVAVITGGASGIGREIAIGYAREGADIVVADINLEGAKETVEAVKVAGKKSFAVQTDVSVQAQVMALFKTVIEEFGKVDILVNSAGINEETALEDCSVEQWDHIMGVNLDGSFYCIQEACRFMAKHGGGKIINISSVAAIRGRTNQQAYSASKAGLRGLTCNVSVQMGQYGINVNSILPGWIDTDFPEGLQKDPKYCEFRTKSTPLRRLGTPKDIVGPAVFLASADADFITGHTLVVDGGASVDLSGMNPVDCDY